MGEQKVSSLVTGGAASAGPPLGPALGPLGEGAGRPWLGREKQRGKEGKGLHPYHVGIPMLINKFNAGEETRSVARHPPIMN